MKLKILEAWRRIRSSFWFLPSAMVASAIALAFACLIYDRSGAGPAEGPLPWLTVAGVEAARSLLATIAGSMITVAGVTFSIVIVALTLASSQFGPRLLAGFMQDTGNQVVLGSFISVFTYCLVVLLHLPGEAGSRLLPQTAVLVGVALAVLAVGVLIFFFHHISTAIQAGEMIREAGITLDKAIRSSLPEEARTEEEPWPPREFSEANARVRALHSGYLSYLDADRLAGIAREHDLRIMVEPRAGDFVLKDRDLALVSPADRLNDAKAQAIRKAFTLIEKREDGKDLPLAVSRLTEIAVRSLSPGINDPYTALASLRRLTAELDQLLERLPASSRTDDAEGSARVFFRPPEAEDLLSLAYGPILTYGSGDVRILEGLVESFASLAGRRRARFREVLGAQVDRVLETSRASLVLETDRSRIEASCDRARAVLKH